MVVAPREWDPAELVMSGLKFNLVEDFYMQQLAKLYYSDDYHKHPVLDMYLQQIHDYSTLMIGDREYTMRSRELPIPSADAQVSIQFQLKDTIFDAKHNHRLSR